MPVQDPPTQANPLVRGLASRPILLLCAALMQACLGATYSWSVFVTQLRAGGLGQGVCQLPFMVFYIAFPATALFAGALIGRLGPRVCSMLGATLFGAGWFVAGLGGNHFALVIAGIGVLGGMGVGIAYVVPISTCIRWFPKQKGLVTGVAVAGFGGGAAVVSQVASLLMEGHGFSPYAAFRVLGVAFAVIGSAAGFAMRTPPEGSRVPVAPEDEPVDEPAAAGVPLFSEVDARTGFRVALRGDDLRACRRSRHQRQPQTACGRGGCWRGDGGGCLVCPGQRGWAHRLGRGF